MTVSPPRCRSLLFVPMYIGTFVARAAGRGADAIILDLEDAVTPERKEWARAQPESAIAAVAAKGAAAMVRVNRTLRWLARDAGEQGVPPPRPETQPRNRS